MQTFSQKRHRQKTAFFRHAIRNTFASTKKFVDFDCLLTIPHKTSFSTHSISKLFDDPSTLFSSLSRHTIPVTDFEKLSIISESVFRAKHLPTSQEVALKLFPNDYPRLLFCRELHALSSCKSSFIVPFFSFSFDPVLSIATTYVPHGTVSDALHGAPEAPRLHAHRKALIALAVARAFFALHHQRILHRTLCSAHVLLNNHGLPYLTHFWQSRELPVGCDELREFMGIPGRIAPEILRGKRYSLKSEVYASGVFLWELVIREVAYSGKPADRIARTVTLTHARLAIPTKAP
jgi:serine/threonine protein kinase